MREIFVQVMATSDRYCHLEGISKRHSIFTYQHQPYPTGKHVSPPQNPLFNCLELFIQCCFFTSSLWGCSCLTHSFCVPNVMHSSTVQCQGDLSSGQKGPWHSLASFFPAAVISTALGCVQNTQAETPTQCKDKFGVSQHCHPSAHHGTPKNPLSPPLHHSLGAQDLRARTALLYIRMEGRFGPSESMFFFTNVLLWKWIGKKWLFFSLGTVTRTRAEQEQLGKRQREPPCVSNHALLWLVSTGP